MSGAILQIESGSGRKEVTLDAYLDASAAEAATRQANAWIKSLRHARIDGESFRRRFTYRGDSLWWFAELYLHKRAIVLRAHRTLAAFDALVERERPSRLRIVDADVVARLVVPPAAARSRIACEHSGSPGRSLTFERTTAEFKSLTDTAAAAAGRLRMATPPNGSTRPLVTAFVHPAFWRGGEDGGEEGYIGPVLRELAAALPEHGLNLVGVGPRRNFKARRWWDRALQNRGGRMPWTPIERYAPLSSLAGARQLWRDRHAMARALLASDDLHAATIISGCDCWPLIREELRGVALLQFPWSARAMDEAGAALDTLRPEVAVTYAEAGGWGRALVLEARRRGVATVGLQHGFIYRHWLNYLHELDEMAPCPDQPADRGFPRPDLTVVYDGYAARHLVECGRFPPEAVTIAGSAQLDALVLRSAVLDEAALANTRALAGAPPGHPLVLIASKFAEIRRLLPALSIAARKMPEARLVIKCHPADTPALYEQSLDPPAAVAVLRADADLAALVKASRAIVTVNSTVAIDAMVLGVPALAIGLPNNLSPFVEAGAMAGATGEEDIGTALRRVLYDEPYRARLAGASRDFMNQYGIGASGRAASRTAEAVLRLLAAARTRRDSGRPDSPRLD